MKKKKADPDARHGGIDYADLGQEGCIGLWLAILHYDATWGYAFSTYT
jgi:DNA-directed RNA polymerase sigma subunit (sigma70/sigma32)